MSFSTVLLSLLFTVLASAGELPWIGVLLDSPSKGTRDAVGLTDGVGLKVSRVVSGGPLAASGGKAGDLWWKFDDQILVNRGQMLVLLRSKAPGDSVKVDFYRAGKLQSLTLTLQKHERLKIHPVGTKNTDSEASRFLTKREQIARVTMEDQELSLQREGEEWRFEIVTEGTSVLSALVSEEDLNGKVPAKWHGAFLILKLSLEQQEKGTDKSDKRRVRYVPREKSSEE